MKKIEDYLHLYLGCEVTSKGDKQFQFRHTLISINTNGLVQTYIKQAFGNSSKNFFNIEYVTPVLRPLSDMTEEEYDELEILNNDDDNVLEVKNDKFEFDYRVSTAVITKRMLHMGFDLFGLIDDGLAIDKTKM